MEIPTFDIACSFAVITFDLCLMCHDHVSRCAVIKFVLCLMCHDHVSRCAVIKFVLWPVCHDHVSRCAVIKFVLWSLCHDRVSRCAVIKFVLWLVCRKVNSPIVRALSMDNRNDVMSNSVAIVCGYLGESFACAAVSVMKK